MDDSQIIELFFQRSETAIDAAEEKYGALCRSVTWNLLGNEEDVQECVNDTWHSLWRVIPPQRPEKLAPFIAKIARNLAMKRLTYRNAEKRAVMTISFEELSKCIPSPNAVEDLLEARELVGLLERFLNTLDADSRDMFLRRYWFFDSVREIARGFGASETKVTTRLYRIRNRLKDYLAEEAQIYVR